MIKKKSEQAIIRAENVSFTYEGSDSPSLDQLNVEIPKGKKIAVMGANGSGKSTFFLCCNGILKPQKGKMFYGDSEFDYSKKGLLSLRSDVGIVFQDPDTQLFASSVFQEISFGILNKGVPEAEARAEVERVMDELSITPFRNRPTHALSGGQKKQVSIADVLVMHPSLMILDEPAAALDPYHEKLLQEIISKMTADGITVMIATHDVNYAYSWADEVILFWEGNVLMQGAPEDVFANKRALELTNLRQPSVIELFEKLRQHGLVRPQRELPRSVSDLEQSLLEGSRNHMDNGDNTMTGQERREGILVVSFGTSHDDTRKVTIDAIEEDIATQFPQAEIYRAWTSDIIRRKLKKRDQITIHSVTEAMELMKAEGITDVIVQPTHVINGVENEKMKEEAGRFQKDFASIRFGDPLLTTAEDNQYVIQTVAEELGELEQDEVLVLMGHGTTHYANAIYAALDYEFKDRGYPNIYLGTVEAYPSIDTILQMVKASGAKKVCLAPFMIVAGDHAKNDLSGEDEESWFSRFREEGYEVRCVLKGLGEFQKIRRLFLSHIVQVRIPS